ncbi:hypothetical protein [Trebonia sp.]|uniref:hypothetical protein n=1 Tax=Trebonia sp. TaxID=2767075 RepID=UPI0026303A6E|nr:hypothetical protein [Trebonia sp.]
MSDRNIRTAGRTRWLVWTAAACITVSLVVMIAISVAGPSISVPAMAHTTGAPPWWVSLGLPGDVVLFTLWGAAVVAAVGVGAGLLAVARGARPRVRPLLAVSFIAVAAFVVLPPAGTTDTQSYAIDGNMVVLGHSPYVDTPRQMVKLGDVMAVNSPVTWQHSLSDYGPLATAEEWVSAELGGSSIAQITFWLKLWVAAAFAGVTLLLDTLLRGDPARRLRAHLLWSLNPLVIWEIVASGHIDGLAVAVGVAGLVVLRFGPHEKAPSMARCVGAGALIGAAVAVKSPFVLFALGAAWALRRSPAAIAWLAAGFVAVIVPSYAIAGAPAVKVLFQRGNQVTWDNLYQVFYRPFGVERFGSDQTPAHLVTIALLLFIAVALLALFRMPNAVPELPAVTPALALSLGWIFFWPYQRPWYDVMIIALLALYPPSWLDGVVLVRLCFGAITYMEATALSHHLWLQRVQLFEGEWITSSVRMLCAAALLWMCISGRWGLRPSKPSADVRPPVLQPQT